MKQSLFTLAMLVAVSAAQADVLVSQPWVRSTVATQKATGAFMQLHADADARLVSAASPVAGVVEIHEMVMQGDVMKMRPVAGLEIAKGQMLELKPGGYHIMLMELKQPLKPGETVPLTLVFEDKAGKQQFSKEVAAPVVALGLRSSPMQTPAMHQHQH